MTADVAKPTRPAFEGAAFDKHGFCLSHPNFQLADPIKLDGKLAYEEISRHCPECRSEKSKSKKGTSLGGGKVRSGHKVHGSKEKPEKSSSKKEKKEKREYDSPFDEKGRCHYHKNVQMAAKKMGGGWKILVATCPKCIEDDYVNGDDDRSVRSNSSRRSMSSRKSGKSARSGDGPPEDAQGQFDKNGCCVLHSHVQVAKKKVLGGWKVVRTCPACAGEDVDLDDACSVASGRSAKSTSSRRSTKSGKGSKKSKSGHASKSGRYGKLPFDGDGYCCQHPSVQIAKKKTLGGWKIIHDVCPECADEMGVQGTKKKPSRRKSAKVVSDGSDTESVKSTSSKGKKKGKKVKNFKTEDENGDPGVYTGEVNSDYRPHGQGTMKYNDGSAYEGLWSEGSQVHGKMRRRKSKF